MNTTDIERIVAGRYNTLEKILQKVGRDIVNKGLPHDELSDVEILSALYYIVTTSQSEEDVVRRVKYEFGYPHALLVVRLAEVEGRSMGGFLMENGIPVQITIDNPRGEKIIV